MHARIRPFDPGLLYGGGTSGHAMCMALRAGEHLTLRAQGGFTLGGQFTGPGDAAAQAEQAMSNIQDLLAEAGATWEQLRKVTTYVTDRAWLAPVAAVVDARLGGAAPARGAVIVAGLATPQMLVAIEAEAILA